MKLTLTHSQTVDRCREINERMGALNDQDSVSKADQREFDELGDEFDQLNRHRQNLERKAQFANGGTLGDGYRREPGTSFGVADNDDHHDSRLDRGLRTNAMRQLDRHVKAGSLPASGAEIVEGLLDTGTSLNQSWTARWAAAAGSEEYTRAFAKLVGNPTQGHLRWTPQEHEAFRVVEGLRDEQRAMSLTDAAGGYLVPAHLDPAIVLFSNGSQNPLRQIARVVQTNSESYNAVTSAGVTAEVADASPALAQPSIPVYKADAFVPFSFEIEGDALSFMTELGKLLQDGADQLTSTAYTTGDGSGKPTGVITGVVAAGGASVVAPTTAETFAATDVFKVQNAAAPRFQPNASWMMNLSFINTCRQFETTAGALKFPELAQNPPQLLGRNVYENSNMDSVINPAAVEQNYVALYGDFAAGFYIVDRIGSTLEIVPHLVGANRRPTGQRGALLWFRTGSGVVVPNAFRVLSIPTS